LAQKQKLVKMLDTSKRNESFALRLKMPTEDYRSIQKKRKGDGMKWDGMKRRSADGRKWRKDMKKWKRHILYQMTRRN